MARGAIEQPGGDHRESEGQGGLDEPDGHAIHQGLSKPVLRLDKRVARHRQERCDQRSDGAGEHARDGLRAPVQDVLSERRQQEQATLARGDRAAEHASHQAQVLNDERRRRDPDAGNASQDGVGNRHDDHRRERHRHEKILRPVSGGSGLRGHGCADRYSATRCLARSNMSAGTIDPRSRG